MSRESFLQACEGKVVNVLYWPVLNAVEDRELRRYSFFTLAAEVQYSCGGHVYRETIAAGPDGTIDLGCSLLALLPAHCARYTMTARGAGSG